jgi:predicted TIM-barrel enzyme
VLWDPYASIDLAAATGAKFIREIMSGVYASDFGLGTRTAGPSRGIRQGCTSTI